MSLSKNPSSDAWFCSRVSSAENDAQIFRAFGHFDAGQFLHAERVGPVVRHRTKIIEPIRVRHRAEIARVLADLLVIAMQIAEHRLQFAHDFAIERDVHAEDAVRRGMLRAHRNFEQLAFESSISSRCGWR